MLTGLGSYTHCLKPEDAVFRSCRPVLPQLRVTFSLNGTNTLASSERKIFSPSFLSSGRETHWASTIQNMQLQIEYLYAVCGALHLHSGMDPFHTPEDVHSSAEEPDIMYPKLHWNLAKSPKWYFS